MSITAAKQLGLSVAYYPVKDQQELDAGLAAAHAAGTDALVLFPDGVTNVGRERIATFALQHKLPTVSGWDIFPGRFPSDSHVLRLEETFLTPIASIGDQTRSTLGGVPTVVEIAAQLPVIQP